MAASGPAAIARKRQNLESVRRYRARNIEKVRETDREQQRKRWQGSTPEVHHANRLRTRHGLTPAGKQAMLEAQGARCYLCGDELSYDKAFIDHDHSCCPQGRSCAACRRGLACDSCNTLIGYARDDPARLRRIAANTGEAVPTARVRRVEPVLGQDLPVAEQIMRRSLEHRTGRTVLPLGLEDEVRLAFRDIDSQTGEKRGSEDE